MQIILSNRAVKAITQLNEPDKGRIKNAIAILPHGDVKKLKGYSTAYRLRVGNWRILYDNIDGRIEITDILTRGSAYK